MSKKNITFTACILAGLIITANPLFVNASAQEDIEIKNKQIEELRKQIDEYQQQIDEKGKNARSLSNEISIINSKISQIQTEIRSLALSIEKTSSEIDQTSEQIKEAEDKILKNENFSSFFNNLNNLQTTQESLRVTIEKVRELKSELEVREESLSERKEELENLRQIQQIEKRSVEQVRSEKNNLLKVTKGEEAKFQSLVKKSQADIEKIRAQVFYLQQNGVSAEEAVKYAQLAAIGVGIRPAFLLGILEIESGLGKKVGTGNWLKDMYQCYLKLKKPERAEQEKNAFFAIVTKLGLNPDTVKVSREPNYGCGGALGPAQFIPTTWLGYEADVARLTGHQPPNPWNVEDAFTASAIKLGRAGATAKTRSSEIAAAKAYISGKSNCSTSTCNYYANSVLRKAEAIEKAMR